ncbi:glycosyltransferase family 4 protein [candidate division WWE3 bacterium]|nr:glycosyltransferase family 4 protein [candidate division WWE3 bacterium]
MPRIGIDARIYKTGIGRYTRNLLDQLATIAPDDSEFIIFLRKDGFDEYQPPGKRFTKVLADYQPYTFSEQIRFLNDLRKYRLDLVHFTNFNVPILWWGNYVVTIHDLIHQSHSTFGSSTRNYLYYVFKKLVYWFVIRWVGLRAQRVIVPSIATKDDIVRDLGIDPAKVVVTYEGMDESLLARSNNATTSEDDAVLKRHGIDSGYILYVATMYPHKNHASLIEAFRQLLHDGRTYKLVLVGKVDFFSNKLRASVLDSDIRDQVIFPNFNVADGYLSDQELQVLYRHASIYVFPSLKEGFGIPILEAQAYGLPVVSSNKSCLPEIGGDSVIYVNPENPAELKTAITKLLDDASLRDSLVKKGYENIKRFSWNTMAKETYQAYREVLKI